VTKYLSCTKTTVQQYNSLSVDPEKYPDPVISKFATYFYVKELIDSNSLQLVHLPTEQMHADFLTKPNQGKLFLRVRVWFLLGYDLQGESYRHRVFLQLITWFPCMYILLTDRPLFCFHVLYTIFPYCSHDVDNPTCLHLAGVCHVYA
jgi:hypothetical protein